MALRAVLVMVCVFVGVGLVLVGVWMIYEPAAFIVAGVLLGSIGILADLEPKERDSE